MDCKDPNWYPFFILIVKNLLLQWRPRVRRPVQAKRGELGVAKLWEWLKRGNGFDRTEFSRYLHKEAVASDPNLLRPTIWTISKGSFFCIKPRTQEPRRVKSANVK